MVSSLFVQIKNEIILKNICLFRMKLLCDCCCALILRVLCV